MDCSPPGSSVPGIFQARVLEWGAIAFSHTTGYQVSIYSFCYIHPLCHDFWYFAYVCMDLTPSRFVSLPNTTLLQTTSFVLLLQVHYMPYVAGPTIIGLLWWLRQQRMCLQWRRPRFNPLVRNIPWRREWLTTPVFLPGESHGQRSLAGYSHGFAKSQTWLSNFAFPFHFHPLEKRMANLSGILAWRIPWTEEPGRLQSMRSQSQTRLSD